MFSEIRKHMQKPGVKLERIELNLTSKDSVTQFCHKLCNKMIKNPVKIITSMWLCMLYWILA